MPISTIIIVTIITVLLVLFVVRVIQVHKKSKHIPCDYQGCFETGVIDMGPGEYNYCRTHLLQSVEQELEKTQKSIIFQPYKQDKWYKWTCIQTMAHTSKAMKEYMSQWTVDRMDDFFSQIGKPCEACQTSSSKVAYFAEKCLSFEDDPRFEEIKQPHYYCLKCASKKYLTALADKQQLPALEMLRGVLPDEEQIIYYT